MNAITQFAAAGSTNVFSAIGLDWQMFIFQVIGFVILVWLMSKYVYPPLIKTIDERQAKIDAGNKAASVAEKKATEAKADIEKLLKQARADAADIVSTAKEEAAAAAALADTKAKARADHLIADAHEQVEKDIVAARKMLHNETLSLVTLATEKVVGKTITSGVDESVMAMAVKEAK